MPPSSPPAPEETGPKAACLEVTCAVIWREGRILLARRSDSGLWELPGGKVKDGEELRACLAREIIEELGARVEVLEHCGTVAERGPERALNLHAFVCRLLEGEPSPLEHRELRWVTIAEMISLDLCQADRRLAEAFSRRPPLAPAGSGS